MSDRKISLPAIQLATCLGFLVVQLDVSVVNVGLGALQQAFNMDLTGLQWVINSYGLFFSALLILGGALGDKFGARNIFAFGFLIFTLASVGCGLAGSISVLITFRGIQGIGAALLIPTSLTLIRLSFHDLDKRRTAVAMWGASGGIALAAGPVIGGLIIQSLGWRSVFLINVPIGVLALVLITRFAPPSPKTGKGIDSFGQTSIAIAIACLTYAFTEFSAQQWSTSTQWTLCLAIIFTVVFVLIELRVQNPMLPPRLAANKVLAATALSGAAINFTFYGTVFALSIYFQTILHYDAFETGMSFIPLTAVLTISTMISARIARTVKAVVIITAGFLLQIAGFIALSKLASQPSFWLLNAALMMVGVGSAASVPSITNSMLSSVTQHDAGIASGLMASARQLGGVIGVAVFGTLISHTGSFSQGMAGAMQLSAVVLLVCIGVNIYTARSRATSEVEHP
jgi:DHA2 family methylenomycin A resistance protein-like MFS transporter